MAEVTVSPAAKETIITLGDGTVVSATISQEKLSVVSEQSDPIVIDLNSGTRGQPGSAILVGDSYPLMSQGSVGDIFLSTSGVNVGAVYKKTETAWVEQGNVRGPAGGIESVNGDFGPGVVLDKASIGLPEVDNTSDADKPVSTATQTALDLKANTSDTVNLTGAQTIAGVKTFSSAPIVPVNSFSIDRVNGLQAALNSSGNDSALVHLAGAETITGVKTFSAAPSFNAGALTASLGPGSADHAYLAIFARTSSPGVRSGYFGVGTGGSTLITVANEMTNGSISLSPNGTGTVNITTTLTEAGQRVFSPNNLPTKTQVGLANVDNTSDANKPVSTAQQTALNLKANLASPTFTGTVAGITATMVGLGNVANLAQVDLVNAQTIAGIKTFSASPIVPTPTTATQAANMGYVDTKVSALVAAAPAALDTLNELATALGNDANFATTMTTALAGKQATIPVGTTAQYYRGDKTWATLDKTAVGLANVDNTSDANKPVSTAQQTALNLKANLASPTFTGTVAGITATMVGLGNVANLAQVDLVNAQTIAGIKTFSATPVFSSGITVTGTATATTFSGSGSGLTALNAAALSTNFVPQTVLKTNIARIVHGAVASTARPTGVTYVEWIGSVQPTNMAASDTWVNTSATGNTADMFPSGMIVSTASSKAAAQTGWYFIEGQQILISGDTALYNEITNNGTVFPYGANTNGAGAAGSTHFRLPDARGRVIAHADGTTEFSAVGTVFGAKSVTLTIAQVPNVQGRIQAHSSFSHWWTPTGAFASSAATQAFAAPVQTGTQAASLSELLFNNGGGGGSHNNIQPTLTLRYMIKR